MSDSPIHRDPFPLTIAQLFGNFCETLFYGIYLVTCLSCVRVFLDAWTRQVGRWGRSRRIRWLMTMTALALFTICTFDTVIGLVHNIQAFVHSNDPEKEFVNLSNWITIARSVNQVIAMLIGDFILVFRCWIIYGRQYLIILPSLTLFLVDLAMAAKLTEIIANPHVTANMNVIIPWWLSFLALTAAQNTLTTLILIWRIWKVEKRTQVFLDQIEPLYQSYHLRSVIHIIAESGMFYTTCVVITFIVSAIKSNALYPVSNITLIVTGISFNAILARSSSRHIQHFTKVGTQQNTGVVVFGNLTRPDVVELAAIGSEAEAEAETEAETETGRTSSRDNLNSVKVTKLTTTTS